MVARGVPVDQVLPVLPVQRADAGVGHLPTVAGVVLVAVLLIGRVALVDARAVAHRGVLFRSDEAPVGAICPVVAQAAAVLMQPVHEARVGVHLLPLLVAVG